MTARQTDWPRQWLMTDERMGERLWTAIERLPPRAGIVFRHYATDPGTRAAMARRIADLCRSRGLVVAIARDVDLARAVGADLVHNPATIPVDLPFSRAIHSLEESDDARHMGAALVFVSPVYATRSHPEQPPLGPAAASKIARAAGAPAIALGGMNADRFAALEGGAFHGWAAIDAWMTD